jgi:uncharacterized protein YkwD
MKKGFALAFSVALLVAGQAVYFGQSSGSKGRGKVARVVGSLVGHDYYRSRRAEKSDWVLDRIEPLEQSCFNEVNRQRWARGLQPLKFSERLLEVARDYSRRMAEEGFFSHEDLEGRTVRQRVNEAGIRWQVLGENLAYSRGYINPVAVAMRGWLASPSHRRNLLDPEYRYTAVGAWIGDDGTVYFTEIFLK